MFVDLGCVAISAPSLTLPSVSVFTAHSWGRSGFLLSSALSSSEVLEESWGGGWGEQASGLHETEVGEGRLQR